MPDNTAPLPTTIDWEILILEVQTDPAGASSDSFGQLYLALFGYLEFIAQQWLERNNLCQAQDHALVAIGLDKIYKEIGKFCAPLTDSEGIGRAFKGWCSTVCKREWKSNRHVHSEQPIDPVILEEWDMGATPSVEESVISEEASCEPLGPQQQMNVLRRQILAQELDRLPEAMRDALLETEGEKSVANPKARGKQGESAAIAQKHGVTPGAVRQARMRLVQRVDERFKKESCS